jgi:dimethylglycine dehydrogenase
LVTLEVGDITHSDARGNEPIYRDGKLVGRCTSGGFGWRVNKSLALGMVPPEMTGEGTQFEVEILGQRYPASIIAESPYDPGNKILRS